MDVTISIDGTGRCKAQTPIHFLNHMLDVGTWARLQGFHGIRNALPMHNLCLLLASYPQQIASHGLFDLDIEAQGDTWIDDHHTNEDLGVQTTWKVYAT